MNLRPIAASAAFITIVMLPNPAGAQMVVIDPAILVQQIQQVASWVQQYKQMATQIAQMSGDRGMANLLPGARTYLPGDWTTAMTTLSASAQQTMTAQSVLNAQQMGTLDPQTRAYLTQARTISAAQQSLGQSAYNEAAQRVVRLQGLTTALAGQTDPKAVMDLTARIQSENAGLVNDNTQMQAIASQVAAQARADDLMRREVKAQMSGNGSFPRFDTSPP